MSLSRSLTLGLSGLTAMVIAALAFAFLAVSSTSAVTPVYVNPGGACAGLTPCYTTIQEAVDNTGPGASDVFIFPGTYAESVNLDSAPASDIALTSVDSTGAPAAGTVTVAPATDHAIHTGAGFGGAVTINGIIAQSPDTDGIAIETTGDVTLTNITASNQGDNGVYVDSGGAVTVTGSTANDNTIGVGDPGFEIFGNGVTVTDSVANGNDGDGFFIQSNGDVAVSGSTANGNDNDGMEIDAVNGTLTINQSTANNNDDSAFPVGGEAGVTMTGLTAIDNGNEGIHPHSEGPVLVTDSFASGIDDDGIDIETEGDATIKNSTSTLSGDDGVQIDAGGVILIDGLTSTDNGQHPEGDGDGVEINSFQGGEFPVESLSIVNSLFTGNDDQAIDIDDPFVDLADTDSISSNIICENSDGYASDSDITVDGAGNWWGSATGPTHPNNPGGTGDNVRDGAVDSSGTFVYTPWIDTGSGSGAPATQGLPSAVTFQFTGGATSLQQGPGDPNGPPTFTASTDNGTVTTSGFISGGTLEVTLTPANAGQATVTVTGPCGLTATTAPIAVAAGAVAPTAPVVTPVQLPETGGSPDGGSASPLPLALFAALLAVLGLGGFALARRRATG